MPEVDEQNNKIIELYARIRELEAKADEVHRKELMLDQKISFNEEKRKSQLLTIYYFLEQLAKVGTHHEKEVVIRYIRMSIHGFLKETNFCERYDDLPF